MFCFAQLMRECRKLIKSVSCTKIRFLSFNARWHEILSAKNMPREIITIQCGQCGNQMGCRFWEMALREHAACNPKAIFDDSLSSLFHNVDARFDPPTYLPVGEGNQPIFTLKARAVLVDMEEGVVQQLLKGRLSDLFNTKQYITDISGSGNNWAHGHHFYGPKYADDILEKIRREVELCHSLQSFLLMHSLGGGTGSGLGSYILELMHDAYPKVFRLSASVFPSADDDVVTSPYNSLLSIASLAEHADCVFPIENQALIDILRRNEQQNHRIGQGFRYLKGKRVTKCEQAFDAMNGIAATLILHLTSSMRFEGQLNVDLNEITTNLVPYPRLHFLVSSLAPYFPSSAKVRLVQKQKLQHAHAEKLLQQQQSRFVNQLFTDVLSRDNQLIKANPVESTYLACAFLLRGNSCTISDLNDNVTRFRQRLKMVHWNSGGFKVGICDQPSFGIPLSLLCLSNNTCMGSKFSALKDSFNKLFKKRVYVHHYAEYMDVAMFDTSSGAVDDLIADYAALDSVKPVECTQFFRPVV